MKNKLFLISCCFLVLAAVQAQEPIVRRIDIKTVIADTSRGDTLFYKGVVKVGAYIINNGPDTIIPGDRLYVKYNFAGIVFSPEFPIVNSYLVPGDTFFHTKTIGLIYSFTNDSVPICVFARMSVTEHDSVPKEYGNQLKDNETCFVVAHKQWRLNSKKPSHSYRTAYPNPANTELYVPKMDMEGIVLYDNTGKRVAISSYTQGENHVIDVRKLQAGFYIVRQGNYAQKILIQH